MSQPSDTRKDGLIVTVRGITQSAASVQGPFESKRDTGYSREVQKRYQKILDKLVDKTREGSPDVFVTIDDRETSRFQSYISREATAGRSLPSGGLEAKFGTGLSGGDWWGWMKSLLDWVDRQEAHPIRRPTSNIPDTFADIASIAMVADWGTGLYGAPVSSKSISNKGPFDLILHLGDVYYSGTEEEIASRFLRHWPRQAGTVSRALNSNHEMYSGGYGYFKIILPTFEQTSSYFALQNNHWLLIGLDTAYIDHELDTEQVKWLNAVVKNAARRKIVLFSHHQLFSRLGSQGPKLLEALSDLLTQKDRKVAAWYWGHEHECILYDRHNKYGFSARCLGNGGVPEPRKDEVKASRTEHVIGGISWKRLSATSESPQCLVLDGPNPYIIGEEDKFGPHGFMTLEFNGPSLIERVYLPDGIEVFNSTIE